MKKKKHELTLFLTLNYLLILLSSCAQNYDRDLIRVNSEGNQYFTTLGCLVHAPWQTEDSFFNAKIFLKGKEIQSSGAVYDKLQKDLVFELHKNGSLSYWLKSENNIIDSSKDGITRTITQQEGDDNLRKKYNKGFWKVTSSDSIIMINFANKNIPNITLKFTDSGGYHLKHRLL